LAAEPPVVAANWRRITRTAVGNPLNSSNLVVEALAQIGHILVTAAAGEDDGEDLLNGVKPCVTQLFEVAIRVQDAIFDRHSFSTLEAFSSAPGIKFDSTCMETPDALAEGTVCASAEVGLRADGIVVIKESVECACTGFAC
jgi:hypothetical protein